MHERVCLACLHADTCLWTLVYLCSFIYLTSICSHAQVMISLTGMMMPLLCASSCSRPWGYSSEHDSQPLWSLHSASVSVMHRHHQCVLGCVCVCPSNCGSVEGSDLVGVSSRAGMSPGAGLGTPGRVGAACPNPGSYVDIVLEQGSCG